MTHPYHPAIQHSNVTSFLSRLRSDREREAELGVFVKAYEASPPLVKQLFFAMTSNKQRRELLQRFMASSGTEQARCQEPGTPDAGGEA